MTRLAPATAALAALLSGCLDFEPITAPYGPDEHPAYINGQVTMEQGPDVSRLRLSIYVMSGRDRNGVRPVIDDRIWIDGIAVVPERRETDGGIGLHLFVERDIPTTPIEIRLPSIGRIDASPPDLTVPVFPSTGADTIRAVDGEDLRITLESVPLSRESDQSWYSVTLRREVRHVFYASVMSLHPPVFIIPGAMMTAVPGSSDAGELLVSVGRFSEWFAPTDDLMVTFRISANRTHPIRFVSP
jgi:hypothetical protein